MKKKSKIRSLLAILMIALMTGFTCAFVQGKSTTLVFTAEAVETKMIPLKFWTEDGVDHVIFYKENNISGAINGIPCIGHTEETFHMKIDPDSGVIVNGRGTFFVDWNGLEGSFYGTVKAKIGAGGVDGKFVFQGAGDFNRWKLFGFVYSIDANTNGIFGTILVPN